jgi:molybdate transport system substrate-binding protein
MQKMHDFMRALFSPWSIRTGLHRAWLVWGVALMATSSAVQAQNSPAGPLKVAAAANLKFVLADIETQYRQQTGQAVQFNFGASVQLARQIQQGLPVQLFISADEEQVAWLQQNALTQDGGQRYAIGLLALISLQTHPLAKSGSPEAALRALASADKLALANPQLAPYGLAAQQVLQKNGLWAGLQKQVVLGENIGQATQYVLTGAAPLGFTAFALTLGPETAGQFKVWPVPPDWHAPLNQRMVLLKGASPQAQAFRDYLLSPQARALFLKHGYALPQ